MAPKGKNTKQTKVETPETPVVLEAAPVPAAEPVATAPVAQKGGAKKSKASAKAAEAPKVEEVAPKAVKAAKGGKAKAAPKEAAPKEAAPKEAEAEADVEGEEDSKTRSFKVQLPGEEAFSGRFTGLTPYQAANKALSKYFRSLENNNGDEVQVNFSIKESTRGSKRHTYTYRGSRLKLEKPITYTIKSQNGEDRVITKQYKNQLVKVKKNVPKQEAAAI